MDDHEIVAYTPEVEEKKEKKDKRTRKQFRFWLDESAEKDAELLWYCEQLIKVRQWQRTVKEALTLYGMLQSNDLSLLVKLFPTIDTMLYEYRYNQNKAKQNDQRGGQQR